MSGRMPVVFIGHGSPMNAIEDNAFTKEWGAIGSALPRPQAILCVSAHWYTQGTRVTDADPLPMVYDMYGFPEALYRVVYPAPGAPALAARLRTQGGEQVALDNTWGLDHGAWSVLCRMFPDADIPVLQLSVDRTAPPETHFALGRQLHALRKQGVLILASGNVVHNLRRVDWDMEGGYPWADSFDNWVRDRILGGAFDEVVRYREAGEAAVLSAGYPDHFYPLLYALGAAEKNEPVQVHCDARVLGGLSMTSYVFG